MLVSIYVFESVFGNDLVNIIKEFIEHPLKESRKMRKHLLLREICSIYDLYCVDTQKIVSKLNRRIYELTISSRRAAPRRDDEDIREIRDIIEKLYYHMNCVTDYELMKYKPRICL
jgi:hypothetical protein